MMPRIKTSAELGKYFDEILDDLSSGAIAAKVARERTKVANKILKTQLDKLRNARKKGEKPNIPFWNEQ
jgi:hypothetical protein